MDTLNDVKLKALEAALSTTGALNDLEFRWLGTLGRTGNLNDRWFQQFGYPDLSYNDAAWTWLGDQGATQDTLNERWYWYWTSGPLATGQVTHLGVQVTYLAADVTYGGPLTT